MGKEGGFWSVEIQRLSYLSYTACCYRSVEMEGMKWWNDQMKWRGACSILVGEACTMRVLGAIQVVAWSQLSHAAVGEMGKHSSGPESQRQDFKIHTCSLSALPWLNTQGKRRWNFISLLFAVGTSPMALFSQVSLQTRSLRWQHQRKSGMNGNKVREVGRFWCPSAKFSYFSFCLRHWS